MTRQPNPPWYAGGAAGGVAARLRPSGPQPFRPDGRAAEPASPAHRSAHAIPPPSRTPRQRTRPPDPAPTRLKLTKTGPARPRHPHPFPIYLRGSKSLIKKARRCDNSPGHGSKRRPFMSDRQYTTTSTIMTDLIQKALNAGHDATRVQQAANLVANGRVFDTGCAGANGSSSAPPSTCPTRPPCSAGHQGPARPGPPNATSPPRRHHRRQPAPPPQQSHHVHLPGVQRTAVFSSQFLVFSELQPSQPARQRRY